MYTRLKPLHFLATWAVSYVLPSFRNVKIRTMVNPVFLTTPASCPNDSARGTDAVNSKSMALATTLPGCDADCSSGGSCLLFIGIRIIIKITTYRIVLCVSYVSCVLYPVTQTITSYSSVELLCPLTCTCQNGEDDLVCSTTLDFCSKHSTIFIT